MKLLCFVSFLKLEDYGLKFLKLVVRVSFLSWILESRIYRGISIPSLQFQSRMLRKELEYVINALRHLPYTSLYINGSLLRLYFTAVPGDFITIRGVVKDMDALRLGDVFLLRT